jgi:hypothetical protein
LINVEVPALMGDDDNYARYKSELLESEAVYRRDVNEKIS